MLASICTLRCCVLSFIVQTGPEPLLDGTARVQDDIFLVFGSRFRFSPIDVVRVAPWSWIGWEAAPSVLFAINFAHHFSSLSSSSPLRLLPFFYDWLTLSAVDSDEEDVDTTISTDQTPIRHRLLVNVDINNVELSMKTRNVSQVFTSVQPLRSW